MDNKLSKKEIIQIKRRLKEATDKLINELYEDNTEKEDLINERHRLEELLLKEG